MYIKKVILNGYKRILLSDIRSLTITMDSIYQVILGTNGSRKSSLLQELTPLPGDPKDYLKGGSKEIHIDHDGHSYVMKSEYNGAKHHHVFLKDNEEKNDGHTITVQKELVRQEFGITEEIRDLLTGTLRFTNMSPSKRREIITMMSDTDLTYAMGIYKKLATIARDNQGTVKHLRQRIAKETDQLRALGTQDDIETQVKKLQDELTILMEHRRADLPPSSDVERRLQATLSNADAIADKILRYPYREGAVHYGSLEALTEATRDRRSQIQSKQELLNHQSKEHDKLASVVGSLGENGVGDLKELTQKAETLRQRIQSEERKLGEFRFADDVGDLEPVAQSIKVQLTEILNELPDNADRKYSRAKLESVEQALKELRSKADSNASKASRTQKEIDHIQSTQENKCPKCSYVWKPGVSEGDVERLQAKRKEYEAEAEQAEALFKKYNAYREAIHHYAHHFGRLRTLAHTYPKAKNLFDWLLEDERVYHEPTQYISMIDRWMNDLYVTGEIQRLSKELAMVDDTLAKAKMLSDTNVDHIGDTLASLHQQIQSTSEEVRQGKAELAALEKRQAHASRAEGWGQELKDLYRQIQQDHGLMVECLKSETLGRLIRGHQSDLAIKTQKLNEKESLVGIIRDLEKSLAEVEQTHETHKLLCKALSPTDGVIAEQMTAFIACLTDQLNDVIEQIYTYPLKIFPCGIDSGSWTTSSPWWPATIRSMRRTWVRGRWGRWRSSTLRSS